MGKFLSYFLIGVVFWTVVDFATTFAIKDPVRYYSTFMPTLLLFYIGGPLVLSYLIYRRNISGKQTFIAAMVAAFVVEILFTHNAILYTFPLMLIGIPAAVSIYTFLTFVPKWIVDGKLRENKWKAAALAAVCILISLVTLFGSG